jgi:glycerol-3-phosphate dehydrogenase
VLGLFPDLPSRGLTGGALWTDAQVESSERLLIAVLHAAAGHGAAIANRAEVTGLRIAGGRVTGVHVRDGEGTGTLDVPARMVLNAAGEGMARIVGMAGLPAPTAALVAGLNLVLRRPVVPGHALGRLAAGRYLFAVPWCGRSLVGTAYGPPGGTEPRRDAEAFLAEAREAFPWAGLEAADVTAVHRGLVPGDSRGLGSRPLLVDHESRDGVAGLVSIQGVKYTAARSVAQRAVDRVCARLGRRTPSRTATTVLDAAAPLHGPLEERTRRVVREEMALHLTDALLRRLDLGTAGPPEPGDVAVVAATMAAELGWSPVRSREEEAALESAPAYAAVPAAAADRLE